MTQPFKKDCRPVILLYDHLFNEIPKLRSKGSYQDEEIWHCTELNTQPTT
ncbi:MAG: hypothetical protein JNM21_13645 [Taibaiella sp.]|nr:hypothetical protein [Taibaiella sp.]